MYIVCHMFLASHWLPTSVSQAVNSSAVEKVDSSISAIKETSWNNECHKWDTQNDTSDVFNLIKG